MVKYYFDSNDSFVIEDYLNASPFASFLPAVSGVKGKPLYAFYCNRGEAMGGFGVDSKETPITPFDSANLCYQNISLKSFRTFLKIDGEYVEAFKDKSNFNKMIINRSNVVILERSKFYELKITYSTVPNKDYAALIRKVELTNIDSKEHNFEILDGLPIIFPHGLSNYCYKELVSLMSAYCLISGNDDYMPFIKFKTSTGDCSIVSEVEDGNAFVSLDENSKRVKTFVDLYSVFKDDDSLIRPNAFIELDKNSFINQDMQLENKLPCAFSFSEKKLKRDRKTYLYSLFGYFDSEEMYRSEMSKIKIEDIENMIEESERLIDDLLSKIETKTSNHIFDIYVKQSLLDNNLRGGFPINLTKDAITPYYVFSRKHGDMERDYNAFLIPSMYYSSGPGNYRDVLQNRRNDLYLYPFLNDYNIKLFFNLIQLDGQNPLNVAPCAFSLNSDYNCKEIDEEFLKELKKEYYPFTLYTYLIKHQIKEKEEVFNSVLLNSKQVSKANFAEGYWIDHWTYLLDLLENYVSIYPDKLEELFFSESYKYFFSLVYVEPRSEKYCFIKENKIRQYGAIDLARLKKENEKYGYDIKKTYWVKDKNNEEIHTNLISKIFNLVLVKFSCLDNCQLGIEMECEKPGWNDAMNGLPGMFGSGMSETVELLRLISFSLTYFNSFKDRDIKILKEQYDFYQKLYDFLYQFKNGKISSFTYWDKVTSLREEFRKETHFGVDGEIKTIKVYDILTLFKEMKEILEKGIEKAKEIFNGILPTYLVYEVDKYELLNRKNHLGYQTIKPLSFKLIKLPYFLEGPARELKLKKNRNLKEEYLKIKETEIYDKSLCFYKTSASLDEAPFEIGRVHAFTKGWLERECNFLHMSYKYLLGLLKNGLYEEFYKEIKTNLVVFMDPSVYKRSIIEHSSFIVPTVNPDSKLHGKGYFARLTGANAECLDMIYIMFLGEKVFEYKNNELYFVARPYLSKEFFNKGEASIKFLDGLTFNIINRNNINAYEAKSIKYVVNHMVFDEIKGDLAYKIREGSIKKIDCMIE